MQEEWQCDICGEVFVLTGEHECPFCGSTEMSEYDEDEDLQDI